MKLGSIMEFIRDAVSTATDIHRLADAIMEMMRKRPEFTYDPHDRDIVSTSLHRMHHAESPRIALVGITSAGKSSLINALFGHDLAETRRTRDTTRSVLQVDFPSGLRIYDTPGIISNEMLENITRSFLGLRQISGRKTEARVNNVPIDIALAKHTLSVPLDQVREVAPIDMVLIAVNINEPPDRIRALELEVLYGALQAQYPGQVVVTGTHLDEIRKLSPDEQIQILADWSEVFGGSLIPVSSVTGEGLDELVVYLFRALPNTASLAKLQEALNVQRKLSRRSFVITESSNLLGSLALMRGNQVDEIRVITVMIFALICNHYSVDEATWGKFNGNALQIADYVQTRGVEYSNRPREPEGFWENFKAFFGTTFYDRIANYKQLGIAGISTIVPKVYALIHEFERHSTPPLPSYFIVERLNGVQTQLEPALKKEDVASVAVVLSRELTAFFAVEHASSEY